MAQEEERARSRTWCFTLNNYTPEEEEGCRLIETVYTIFGKEVGESGTPHLQGYLVFKNDKSRKQVSSLIPRAWLSQAKADAIANAKYCSKDGDVFTKGVQPVTQNQKGKKERADWAERLKRARDGDTQWLEENWPHGMITMEAKLLSLKRRKADPLTELVNEWWVGTTGTGKSRILSREYPDAFDKQLNKWWDGYQDEEVVFIEEWSPKNECTASNLKRWADYNPFSGQVKNGTLKSIRPKKIIVTSNYTIRDCFPDPRDYEPLERRFRYRYFPIGAVVQPAEPEPAVHPDYNL